MQSYEGMYLVINIAYSKNLEASSEDYTPSECVKESWHKCLHHKTVNEVYILYNSVALSYTHDVHAYRCTA